MARISPTPSNVDKSLTNLFQATSTPPSLPMKSENVSQQYTPHPLSTGVFFFSVMKLFLVSISNSKSDKKGYYGGMNVLDK